MKWLNKYIGQRWTQEHDCGYWFRKILKAEFGIDTPPICNRPGSSPRAFAVNACRTMKSLANNPELAEWSKTATPQTGDAALISLRTLPHHIGLYIEYEKLPYILHAIETNGVQLSSLATLDIHGFKITGYWHYAN